MSAVLPKEEAKLAVSAFAAIGRRHAFKLQNRRFESWVTNSEIMNGLPAATKLSIGAEVWPSALRRSSRPSICCGAPGCTGRVTRQSQKLTMSVSIRALSICAMRGYATSLLRRSRCKVIQRR